MYGNHTEKKKIGEEKWRGLVVSCALDNRPGFGCGFLVLCKAARYFQVHLLNLLIVAWWQGTFSLS